MNKEKILITGAAGTIGEQLLKYYIEHNYFIIAVDYNESQLIKLDTIYRQNNFITLPFSYHDDELIKQVEIIQPDTVIHAATLKNTKYSEIYSDYYWKYNVIHSLDFIKRLIDNNVKRIIFLSSNEAYKPHNQFGEQKLAVESYLKQLNTRSIIQSVRFPFILESSGSVYHIFSNQAINNLPLTVTSRDATKLTSNIENFMREWTIFFENIIDNGVYDFDIGEMLSIYSLAEAMINETQSSSHIEVVGLRQGDIISEEKLNDSERRHIISQIYEVI